MPRRRALSGLAALAALVAGAAVVALTRPPGQHNPRVVGVGKGPTSIAVDTATRRVFVLNATDATVSVLDADSAAVVRTVPVGRAPSGPGAPRDGALALDERAGRVLVTEGMPDSDAVRILDAATGRALRTAHSGVYGAGPLAVDDQAGLAFMSNGVVGVLDVRTSRARLAPLDGTGVIASAFPVAVDRRAGRVFTRRRRRPPAGRGHVRRAERRAAAQGRARRPARQHCCDRRGRARRPRLCRQPG